MDIHGLMAYHPDPAKLTQLADALRSGQYEQMMGGLRSRRPGDGVVCHCLLGVVVDLFAPERWDEPRTDSILGPDYELAAQLLGVDDDPAGNFGALFVEANDGDEQSFASVAEDLDKAVALIKASAA
jgi:hypothetical protein